MRNFSSIGDAIWWLQNNGGGELTVSVNETGMVVTVSLVAGDDKATASGAFASEAIKKLTRFK